MNFKKNLNSKYNIVLMSINLIEGNNKLLVILTQYKRNNLESQLNSVHNQTVKPDIIVVFQNEQHVSIEHLKEKYNFIHVKNSYNTKFFGRFTYCLNFDVEYCIIMDDDIIPGGNCFNNYLQQCKEYNAIIGGNGRIALNNKFKDLKFPQEVGIRNKALKVDFVGHLWCVKQEFIRTMLSIKPFTYDTGEDMHLCFSNKLLKNIDSYCGKQIKNEDMCDIAYNKLADDNHSSFKITPKELRKKIEDYFVSKYNYNFIDNN